MRGGLRGRDFVQAYPLEIAGKFQLPNQMQLFVFQALFGLIEGLGSFEKFLEGLSQLKILVLNAQRAFVEELFGILNEGEERER